MKLLENGFIKIYRSLLSWEWYEDINTTRLFLHLLLTVNYEDKQWRGMEIKRGSRVTSLANLAAETKLTVKSVRTALKHLNDTGEVASQGQAQSTTVTVLNYDKYQQEGKAGASQGQAEGKAGASQGQLCKKEKKAKKDTEKTLCAFERFWEIYPRKRSRGDAERAFFKINPSDELIATICDAVARAKTSVDWNEENGKYIPYPATWLNRKGWEDKYEIEPTSQIGDYEGGLSL